MDIAVFITCSMSVLLLSVPRGDRAASYSQCSDWRTDTAVGRHCCLVRNNGSLLAQGGNLGGITVAGVSGKQAWSQKVVLSRKLPA